ncbi:Trm9 [Lachancea thermotolerans]|uniref:KLTH0G04158p n=1 Tax=Lachancea thermotolerans (strain ATCC 56472 / CBS 6340 / NRRL Y-8284) TaxID=559295 RepID=C5DLW9_LACTC|nr:KLTH0G04158p [Lachancea thermotolerans CBS 6340]CAR24780.1 KLTH0G04158p [Lachancea thermotolerans CBS 6340]
MAAAREQQFVHEVYNEIAPHFSQTRYKPWPVVTRFLNQQEMGSIGIDVGCGNGKYLNVNPNVFIIGSDRSSGLIECAHALDGKFNVLVADGMQLPHRDATFDFAISIAVVHHWSTRERRVAAINHILSKVRPQGRALIYCWALEQAGSRRGYHEGMEQDVLVPWVLQGKHAKNEQETKSTKKAKPEKPDLSTVAPQDRAAFLAHWREEQQSKRAAENEAQERARREQVDADNANTKYRYYHLYKEGELEEDCVSAGGKVVGAGYEKDNWYVIVERQ